MSPLKCLAPEGVPWLLGLLLLAVPGTLWLGPAVAVLLLSAVVLLGWVMREPQRIIPHDPLGLVSPTDGVVRVVEEVRTPLLERNSVCVRIRKSALDPCAIRSPTEGKVREQRISQREGGGWCCLTLVETDEGDEIVSVVSLRRLPWRLRLYTQCGERIGQGRRYGFLGLAADVDVYLPPNTNVKARPGRQVQAGSTVLGHLVHKEAVSALPGVEAGGAPGAAALLPPTGTHGGV